MYTYTNIKERVIIEPQSPFPIWVAIAFLPLSQNQVLLVKPTMFRALSTRRSHQSYEKLGEEPSAGLLDQVRLQRSTTLPTRAFGSPIMRNFSLEREVSSIPQLKPAPSKKSSGKPHPLFSLFDRRRKSKKTATATPEFARYLDYVKEGGSWDVNSNMPVIYYR